MTYTNIVLTDKTNDVTSVPDATQTFGTSERTGGRPRPGRPPPQARLATLVGDDARDRLRFGTREMAGAVADVGVLLPIAVALIVSNGLSATAVLLPAGLLYVAVALVYQLPIPVQPLKAFGAIAIAKDLGSDEIAAGALLMGVIFLVLGRTGLIDLAARAFPKPLIRGVQITVGLLFLKIAWGLVADPPKAFDELGLSTAAAAGLAAVGARPAVRAAEGRHLARPRLRSARS